MIAHLISSLTHFIISTIDHLGYAGVAVLMAIESAAIPLPSEIIMPFAGFLVVAHRFNLFGLGLAGATGSVIGSWIMYAVGYYGGRPLIRKYEHILLVSEDDLNLTENFFKKFGHWSTFLGRMLPIVRTFISIPAGIAKYDFWPFTIAAFVGSFIWSYFLAWLGLKLGERWNHLSVYFHKFDALIVVVVILAAGYWVYRHIKHRVGRR